ncbi:MAG: metallopeptidase family protein, partial [Sandaracinaceae bacterium]|nr:metallopeptidase family protein [Sandaracinaceae bacterium]
ELPAEVHAHLRNVPLFVEDAPSEALIREGVDPRLLGLFTGTPLPDKTIGSSPSAPDAAYVFARNLENVCESRAAMLEEIRVTVLHETAHFFGLDDEQLAELGLD